MGTRLNEVLVKKGLPPKKGFLESQQQKINLPARSKSHHWIQFTHLSVRSHNLNTMITNRKIEINISCKPLWKREWSRPSRRNGNHTGVSHQKQSNFIYSILIYYKLFQFYNLLTQCLILNLNESVADVNSVFELLKVISATTLTAKKKGTVTCIMVRKCQGFCVTCAFISYFDYARKRFRYTSNIKTDKAFLYTHVLNIST